MRNLLTIIGAVRCGSTWLHQSLTNHPSFQCAAGRIKEISYFDSVSPSQFDLHGLGEVQRAARRKSIAERNAAFARRLKAIDDILGDLPAAHAIRRDRLEKERDTLDRFVTDFAKDDAWYRAQFAGREPWAIDSTPTYYAMDAKGFSHMLSIADRVVCVMLLREPAQMLASRLRHSRRARWASPGDQQTYLEYIAGEYVFGLEQVKSLIPAASLRFVSFSEMISEPAMALSTLLQSIDVESSDRPIDRKSPNASAYLDIVPAVQERIRALAGDTRRHLERLHVPLEA